MENNGPDIAQLHTTALGSMRIRRNLGLSDVDVVDYCRNLILNGRSVIERRGKNWYVTSGNCLLTINASSNTVITAKKL